MRNLSSNEMVAVSAGIIGGGGQYGELNAGGGNKPPAGGRAGLGLAIIAVFNDAVDFIKNLDDGVDRKPPANGDWEPAPGQAPYENWAPRG
jgi:hypothetical protein